MNREEFNTLVENGLAVPFATTERKQTEISDIIGMEIRTAIRNKNVVRAEKLEEYLKRMSSNLGFITLAYPQGMPLLLCQSYDERDRMKQGFLHAPGLEDFVLDIGRTIVLSAESEKKNGEEKLMETKFSFEKGEIFATSLEAAKNWRFNEQKAIIEELIEDAENKGEEITEEKIKKFVKQAETIVETIEIQVVEFFETTKRKGVVEGQLEMSFNTVEKEVEKTIEKMVEVEETIKTPTKKSTSTTFINVMGDIENKEYMDDIVVCRKVIPTKEFLLDVEIVFYNKINTKRRPETDDNGIVKRDENDLIIMKETREQEPVFDCFVSTYEIKIDINKEYHFDEETIAKLSEIQVNGEPLVAARNNNGVFLHSFDKEFEKEEIEYAKNIIAKKSKTKKGDMQKIVSFAEIMAIAKEKGVNLAVI